MAIISSTTPFFASFILFAFDIGGKIIEIIATIINSIVVPEIEKIEA